MLTSIRTFLLSPRGAVERRTGESCWRPAISRLVAVVSPLLFATPFVAEAQSTGVPRIGWLSATNPRSAPIFQAFEQRLGELGYVDGRSVTIEFRNAEGQVDRLPGLAVELVQLRVNVIITGTDPATRAAKAA